MIVITGNVDDLVVEEPLACVRGHRKFHEPLEGHGGKIVGAQREFEDVTIQNERAPDAFRILRNQCAEAGYELGEYLAWLRRIDASICWAKIRQKAVVGPKVHIRHAEILDVSHANLMSS